MHTVQNQEAACKSRLRKKLTHSLSGNLQLPPRNFAQSASLGKVDLDMFTRDGLRMASADGEQRLLVYEFMPLGSLQDHLHDMSLLSMQALECLVKGVMFIALEVY